MRAGNFLSIRFFTAQLRWSFHAPRCRNMRVAGERSRSENFERHRQRQKMTFKRGIESSRWRDGYFSVLLALDGWPVVGNLRLIETFKPSRSSIELLPPLISSQCDVSSLFTDEFSSNNTPLTRNEVLIL